LSTNQNVDPTLVENALQEILSSQYFRASAQCSKFLRYIVENTINDRDEYLRERVIGSEVFGRAPDYDTGNDHIVRSRASEVRKRLAQYYQHTGVETGLRISIPSGSYRAAFNPVEHSFHNQTEVETNTLNELPGTPPDISGTETPTTPGLDSQPDSFSPGITPERSDRSLFSLTRSTWITIAGVLLACVGLGFLIRVMHTRPGTDTTRFEKFWAPVNEIHKPVLIYCGGGYGYELSDDFLEKDNTKHGIKDAGKESFVDLKPGESVPGKDPIADRQFIPFGDLVTTARIVSMLSHFNKPYDLRSGIDMAFSEFHISPTIIIGDSNSSWAVRPTDKLRYVLDQDDRIVDQSDSRNIWTETTDPAKQARDEYAVITRLNYSEAGAGSFVLLITGVKRHGTRGAADLITDPSKLNRILEDLPPGWEKNNLQMVIHSKTVNEIPVWLNVEATYTW
jgi:hypothetical protein